MSTTTGGCTSPVGTATVTASGALVVEAPSRSVAKAVITRLPLAAGVHDTENGRVMSTPIELPPSKNSTRSTLPPGSGSPATALSVCGAPTRPWAALATATVGGSFVATPMSSKRAV